MSFRKALCQHGILKGEFWLGTRKALPLGQGCSNSWGPLCISSCFGWHSPPLALGSSVVVQCDSSPREIPASHCPPVLCTRAH